MTRKMMNELKGILLTLFIPLQLLAVEGPKSRMTNNSYPDEGIFTGTKTKNLISNPGFENKTSHWTLGKYNGGKGLFTTDTTSIISEGRAALLITNNENGDYNDLQLFTFIPLARLTRYIISFQADVETTCLISISISNGFDTYYEKRFLLRPEHKFYGPFSFKSDSDDPFCYFSINLGKTNTKILFDDVEIQADYTEKEFEKIIANSGVNVYTDLNNKEINVRLPTVSKENMPITIIDHDGKICNAANIRKGETEKSFSLNSNFREGVNYTVKIFSQDKILTQNFIVK